MLYDLIFLEISFLLFFYKRAKLLMHFFQQEEYDNIRFLKYVLIGGKLIDKKLTAVLILEYFGFMLLKFPASIFWIIVATTLLIFAFIQKNPVENAKKKLAITPRVKRIFTVSFFLIILLNSWSYTSGLVMNLHSIMFLLLLKIQLISLVIVIANLLLHPLENKIKRKYLNQAKLKLKKFSPTVIGITGSFGKTSSKHILNHILSSVASTLTTPGSVNTPMGITRIINDQLTSEHQYFIAEMGAYGVGSINKLCDLAEPDFGIITAVGNSHFERFKTIENVAKAKFELSQRVAKNKGTTFINSDGVDKSFIENYGENPILITTQSASIKDYSVSEIQQTKNGLKFQIKHNKKVYKIKTPLFGLHHIGNISLCFAVANHLGIDADTIIASLESMPQIEHRLQVIKTPNSPVIIDDAYNSNPIGFSSALDILHLLKQKTGRSILVTPGMVELGKVHDEQHKMIGEKAVQTTDIVLAIIPDRIKSFISAFEKNMKKNQQILTFDSFTDAKKWLDKNAKSNDVILYENDLPDLYESKISL